MNPNACYSELMRAIENDDHESIIDRAGELIEWVDANGTMPENAAFDSLDEMVSWMIAARYCARRVLEKTR